MSNLSAALPSGSFRPDSGIPDSSFKVPPSRDTIAGVAASARAFWRDTAIQAIEAAASGLGRDLSELAGRVRAVDLGRRLSPRLSGRLTALMDAVTRRDGYAAIDRLQAWWSRQILTHFGG